MIGDVQQGNEKSKCILIEDTVTNSGQALLASFICSLSKRVEKVHVICFSRNPSYIQPHIPQQSLDRLVFHDGSSDPLGIQNADSLSVNSDLLQYLNNHTGSRAHHSVAVVIDNLSLSLLHRSAPYTCQTIAQFKDAKIQGADIEQVVCLLHSDLHDNHSLTLVEHLATTIVKVIPPKIDQFFMSTQILHKRLSGKVIKITEHFNMDDEYSICDVTEVKSVITSPVMANNSQPDPTANLTFNLSLTDREKEARSQVKLPYTYDKGRQDETLNKSVGEGKIFYQPDEADDFDEDDPDDDLDI